MKTSRRSLAGVLLSLIWIAPAPAFDFSGLDVNKLGEMVGKAVDAVRGIDEPREIEIGSGVAGRLLGAAPLVNNAALQWYVNDVGLWLAMQTERKDLPWRFGVVIAARGGYHPDGLSGALMTLDNMDPEDDAVTLMFKTHPPASERLARLRAVMGDHLRIYAGQPRLVKRLAGVQQSLEAR